MQPLQGFTNPADQLVWGGNYPDDLPLSWTGSFRGLNRTWYTNFGHGIDTWNQDWFVQHVVGGIAWAAAFEAPGDCAGLAD